MKKFIILSLAICSIFVSVSIAQQKSVAKPFTTSGFYGGIGLSSKESGDYYGVDVFLTESDGQLYGLVKTAEGGFSTPRLVEVKTSGPDMRAIEFTLPNETGEARKFKGAVSATRLNLTEDNGTKSVLKRDCPSLYSNIAPGSGGDYGGMEVYLTDAGGPWYALVTIAEGVLKRPVLVEANVTLTKGMADRVEFTLPGENGGRKFTGKMTTTGLTLSEGGKPLILKNKCYK